MNNPRLQNALTDAFLIFCVFGLYIYYVRGFLFSPQLQLSHDNVRYLYPFFIYVSDSLRFGFGIPYWDPSYGGTPIGILLFPFMPHRIIGYVFHLFIDGLSAYRVSLMFGLLTVTAGLWFLIRKLTGNRLAATLSVALFLFGGCGMTVFHQEQIIITMSVLPWIALTLLKIKDDSRFLALFAVLLGVGAGLHYPFLQTASAAVIIGVMIIFGGSGRKVLRNLIKDKRTLVISIALLIASLLPILHTILNIKDFSSPARLSSTTGASDYEDYIEMNRQQSSSATIEYYLNYIVPAKHENDDGFLFFATYPAILLALSALILNFKRSAPVAVLLLFFVWASLGIHAGLPQLLFIARFPFMGQFRQWIHFAPLVNMSLVVLASFGFDEITAKMKISKNNAKTAIAAFAALTLLFAFVQGSRYLRIYEQYMIPSITPHADPDKNVYLSLLKGTSFSYEFLSKYHTHLPNVLPIVVYKNYMQLQSKCPEAIVGTPFVAGQIVDVSSLRPFVRSALLDSMCLKNLMGQAVTVKGPNLGGLPTIQPQAIQSDSISSALKLNDSSVFSSYVVTPKGVTAEGKVTAPGLLVFPFAHKNDFDAALNGDRIDAHPVFEGAMTGISIPAGNFSVSLSKKITIYEIGVLMQYIALVFSALYVFRANGGNRPTGETS